MQEEKRDNIVRKLLRRPSSAFALAVILFSCIVAVFAYQLAPDDTPDANRMIVELGARPPGFTKMLLYVPKSIQRDEQTGLKQFFSGTKSGYLAVPFNSYFFAGDKMYIADSLRVRIW